MSLPITGVTFQCPMCCRRSTSAALTLGSLAGSTPENHGWVALASNLLMIACGATNARFFVGIAVDRLCDAASRFLSTRKICSGSFTAQQPALACEGLKARATTAFRRAVGVTVRFRRDIAIVRVG